MWTGFSKLSQNVNRCVYLVPCNTLVSKFGVFPPHAQFIIIIIIFSLWLSYFGRVGQWLALLPQQEGFGFEPAI